MDKTITPHQAKYYAYELTKRCSSDSVEKFGATLLDAKVDLNPHQVEAALFAFKSPLSKGAILADEVGLGKTIETGILLSQKWATNNKRILIICPSSLRKQWVQELADKFYLPSMVMETKNFNASKKAGNFNPFDNEETIMICSYHFARNKAEFISMVDWDLVVVDEAHYLRNVYKKNNRIANTLKIALDGKKKVLLTATPLQNSLLELYGLVSFIDENVFGDLKSFKSQFVGANSSGLEDLKDRLAPVCNRALRRHVQEYVPYTNRLPITEKFTPSDTEQELYEEITNYLQRPVLYALPASQRHLMTLILRKLLASSSFAITGTLQNLVNKLEVLIAANEDIEAITMPVEMSIEDDYEQYDDKAEEEAETEGEEIKILSPAELEGVKDELDDLKRFLDLSSSIVQNAKALKLLTALKKGFEKLKELGAPQKAIIFTESRRTQDFALQMLEDNGYKGKVGLFNGTNNDPKSKEIYKNWIEANKDTDKVTGSRAVDMRAAIVDYFKTDDCQILIATEAAAEGINLQFCSMLVNYDLPWNPQRIEQRIGRCHRYGQKYDVVVVNFLNTKNAADKRVFALLNEKFQLFDGVFGASDEVLGAIGSGMDFEKRIAEIYQGCRTQKDIKSNFDALQQELEEQINSKLKSTQQKLFENFDADVVDKLKTTQIETKGYVSKYQKWLWAISKLGLKDQATFDDEACSFHLLQSPKDNLKVAKGQYSLLNNQELGHRYRIAHPLAQHIIQEFKNQELPSKELCFDYSDAKINSAQLEPLVGQSGFLHIENLMVKSFDTTDHLLFVGQIDNGEDLAVEACRRMMELQVVDENGFVLSQEQTKHINQRCAIAKEHLIEDLQERDNTYFQYEVDKLHKWAEDRIKASEQELREVKAKIKEQNREARKAQSSEELLKIQTKTKSLESKKKKLRRNIFEVEDEIEDLRDNMIDEIKSRMMKAITDETVLTIRWRVV